MAYLKILDPHGNRIKAQSSTYEAAGFTRRLNLWGTSTLGPDASLYGSLATLRARSRELVRNDPLAGAGLDTLVSNLVGSGISPRWQLSDATLKAQLQQLWADWAMQCDHDGIADFYGMQALAARSMIESGEVLIRFLPQRPGRMAVPLKIQIIEADHLDETYSTTLDNGREIRMGIEFDASGRRVAYHLFKDHPGEAFITADTVTRVRIPASEILHVYRPLRPGQKRGRPWLSAVITTLHELNKYLDAEQVRKSSTAMFGGFVTVPPEGIDSVPDILGQSGIDATGQEVLALEPGSFPTLPPGMDVKFSEPADVGGSYEAFVKHMERRIARGFGGLTYEKLSGDLSGVNYSSIRAGNLEFQRFCLQIIGNVLAFQLCQPVARYWIDQAVLSGAVKIIDFIEHRQQYYRIKWCPDGWPWVDPEKDLKAEQMAIRSGLKSRAEAVAERGRDVEEVDMEQAEDNWRTDALGLSYDSDGRRAKDAGIPTQEPSNNE
ncbi:phage portal protein [Desulfatitalea tepidiphila]|uniref:phage portal protein n=1 Tax=Desulfatitalea tepidiphila TaxID=1185843 RepID=UPI0006B53BDA|nr:phage portal protein [Desulfatitalea tepidiphila]